MRMGAFDAVAPLQQQRALREVLRKQKAADEAAAAEVAATYLSQANAASTYVPLDATITLPNGTAAAPSLNFAGDTTTGLNTNAGTTIGFAVAGSNVAILDSDQLRMPFGALATPGWSWAGDVDTGVYHPSANTMEVVTAGVSRLKIDATNRWAPRTTYTPSVTGITYGSGGYATGVYSVTDGWCRGAIRVYLGSTAPTVGTGASIGLPSGFAIHATYMNASIGPVTGGDVTGALQIGHAMAVYTTAVEPRFQMTAGSAALSQISATVPITWAVNDYITIHFNYLVSY